jgi:hypothetical protein
VQVATDSPVQIVDFAVHNLVVQAVHSIVEHNLVESVDSNFEDHLQPDTEQTKDILDPTSMDFQNWIAFRYGPKKYSNYRIYISVLLLEIAYLCDE